MQIDNDCLIYMYTYGIYLYICYTVYSGCSGHVYSGHSDIVPLTFILLSPYYTMVTK